MADPNPVCPSCSSPDVQSLGRLPPSRWFAGKQLSPPLTGGSLARCTRCELKFRHPMLDAAVYQRLYDKAVITAWPKDIERADWNLIVKQLAERLPMGGRVLDFGCYTGGLLTQLDWAFERFGVEINHAAADAAANQAKATVWRSLEDIPENLRFDAIIASDVIEHMRDPARFISDLTKFLAEDGILVLTTGDAENKLWNRFGASWWYCFNPEHIAFISRAWVVRFSETRDLSVVHYETFRYLKSSITYRIAAGLLMYCYGMFPLSYLRFSNFIGRLQGKRKEKGAPGIGVSADHILIVLNRTATVRSPQCATKALPLICKSR
jgi:SAM-dependent methyltransferase